MRLELVVLGSGGGWPRPNGAACGYLLRQDGFNLWLDAGTGTMSNLQMHVGLHQVNAVAISHRHFDHFLDLYPFFLSRWWPLDGRPPALPFFAPPGMFEHALQLEEDLGAAFDVHPVEPGDPFEVGPFRVRTVPTAHPVPTLGMRVEAGGAALAYSADSGPCDALVSLARGANLFLCEATSLEPRSGDPIHMTATEAGEHGARAEVGRLMLTHIWPSLDRNEAAARAGVEFGRPVELAVEGMRVDL